MQETDEQRLPAFLEQLLLVGGEQDVNGPLVPADAPVRTAAGIVHEQVIAADHEVVEVGDLPRAVPELRFRCFATPLVLATGNAAATPLLRQSKFDVDL